MTDASATASSANGTKKSSTLLDHLRALVGRVGRAYYDQKHVVVLDYLTRIPYVREEDLVAYLKWQTKDAQIVITKLKKDRLVRTQMVPELRSDGKVHQRPLHYIDYRDFVNNIKWRVYRLEKSISEKVSQVDEAVNFVCKQCGRTYDMFEASKFKLFCEDCMEPLEESGLSAEQRINNETLKRFLDQHKAIREILKETDGKRLPRPDFTEVLKPPQKIKPEDGEAGAPGASAGPNTDAAPTSTLDVKPVPKTATNTKVPWFQHTEWNLNTKKDDEEEDFGAPPQQQSTEETNEDGDTEYLKDYYNSYLKTLAQQQQEQEGGAAVEGASTPGGVPAEPAPVHPSAAPPAFLGAASPLSLTIGFDGDEDDEEFVEVDDLGYQDASSAGQKRGRLANDVGG